MIQKTAWVLSGGGAKGAFQVGVIKALAERGQHPDVIYGTSVGALNAGCYSYQSAEGLERVWREEVNSKDDILSLNTFSLLWASGIYSMKPLRKLIAKTFVGVPKCEAVACSVDLDTGTIGYFSNYKHSIDDFHKWVEASSSIPGIMEPVGTWVDGGVREMAPLKVAIDEGATKIVVICANPFDSELPPPWSMSKAGAFLRIAKIIYRAIDGIMEREILVNDLKLCQSYNLDPTKRPIELELYYPPKLLLDTLDFDPIKIDQAITQGYMQGLTRYP